ncbi:MAG: hypothetical protein ACRC1J_03370 [Sandaracinobacteroides sp.]
MHLVRGNVQFCATVCSWMDPFKKGAVDAEGGCPAVEERHILRQVQNGRGQKRHGIRPPQQGFLDPEMESQPAAVGLGKSPGYAALDILLHIGGIAADKPGDFRISTARLPDQRFELDASVCFRLVDTRSDVCGLRRLHPLDGF